MNSNWAKTLEKIQKIEGYLVPGQEFTLYKLAASLKPGATIVEIGCYKGRSTACLAYGAPKDATVYAIDTFEGNKKDFIEEVQFKGGNFYKDFENNLKRLRLFHKIKPIKGFSAEIGEKWKRKIDLIFIDGSHLYEDVKKDFEFFYPWVKPGGIIAFHDVTKEHAGAFRVWNEIAKKKMSAYMHETTLYFGIKPSKISSQYKDKGKLRKIFDYEKEKVTVILPVFNRLELTIKCLASLQRQTYKNLQVVIVDADSKDKTREFIKEYYPDYKIIHGTNKWWWTRSMHEGVKKALKNLKGGDFVLTMNNDCFFEEDYVSNIVEASKSNKRAIVGSLILDAVKTNKVIDAGVKIEWSQCLLYGVAPYYSENIKFYTEREIIDQIDTLPGKGTLVPVEVFKRVGNFNYLLLPHYISDYEFFCRAKRAGYNLIVSAYSQLYNFSRETGIEHIGKEKASRLKIIHALFSRKSKINVIDHILFTLLCCPIKYLSRNLRKEFLAFFVFLPFIQKNLLFLHNVPIYIKQNSLVRSTNLIVHNFPIYLKQNPHLKKSLLLLHNISIRIKQNKVSRLFFYRHKKLRNTTEQKDFPNRYVVISKNKALPLTKAWLSKSIPEKQMKIVKPLLRDKIVPDVAKPVIKIVRCIKERNLNILDVGCSSGYYYDFLKSAGFKNFEYQGCDLSPEFVKLAIKLHPKLKFKVGDIIKLPYKTGEFPLILSSAVLYYAQQNYKKAIKELARVSSKYILLHRIMIFDNKQKTIYLSKKVYDVKMREMVFGWKDLKRAFAKNDLVIRKLIKYDIFDINYLGLGKASLVTILLAKNK